jgi:hypothetical protein
LVPAARAASFGYAQTVSKPAAAAQAIFPQSDAMANKLEQLHFAGGWIQEFGLVSKDASPLPSVDPFSWYRADVWGLVFDTPADASRGLGILADLPFSEGWKNAPPDHVEPLLAAPPDQISVLSPPKRGGALPIVLARYGRFVIRVSTQCVHCRFDAAKPPKVLADFLGAIDTQELASLSRSA